MKCRNDKTDNRMVTGVKQCNVINCEMQFYMAKPYTLFYPITSCQVDYKIWSTFHNCSLIIQLVVIRYDLATNRYGTILIIQLISNRVIERYDRYNLF